MSGYLQLPTRYTQPLSDDFVTDGDKLIELVNLAWKSPENPDGMDLDEWQEWLIRHILERYPDDHEDPLKAGRLRYRQVVVSLGRQNGKSVLGAILGIYGLLMHEVGPNIISVASNVDQAKIIYDRVSYAINNSPALKRRFKKATDTRGIVTNDGGGKYIVKAAKEAALQGIPLSMCLFDELHICKQGMWSAVVLGTSQRKDGIVIGITTAGDDSSETLIDLYKSGDKAIQGDEKYERFGFFVWEAPDNCAVTDPDAILQSNPAVAAGRIPLDRVISDLSSLPEHEARRYRLNQFISGSNQSWLPLQYYIDSVSSGIANLSNIVFAVDRTSNWEYATITASKKNGDKFESEVVASIVEPTEDRLYELLMKLYTEHNPIALAMDDRQLSNLAKRLKAHNIPVYALWAKEISAACSFAYSAFATHRVNLKDDALMRQQVTKGVAKYSGDTWSISRKESLGDVDTLYATIMGMYVSSIIENHEMQVF